VELIGRAEETARLHELIADANAGRGGALILRGEPGIGKTALCAEAARFARDSSVRVLHTVGVESEMHLPYAGLHQLLRPVREILGALPPG
jgi:predicted ATPase